MLILILAPYPPNNSPSQRFRFEHYINTPLSNTTFHYKSFIDLKTWNIIFTPNNFFLKSRGVIKGFIKRFLLLFSLKKYDFIYIHREATPVGPPVFEWVIAKLYKKKIIYDFDDAIWVNVASSANKKVALIKCAWKVKYICKYSHIVTVGNEYLATYARKYCKDVRIIPTVVDTDNVHNKIKNQYDTPITIGWTGTFSNFYNLEKILKPIRALKEESGFEFIIISNKDPQFKNISYTYIKWNVKTEIDDLLKLSIGLMPLYNTEVELGKCAFKAIQYMSLGIPAIVSPVGANCDLVDKEVNGYWAGNDEEWYSTLKNLLSDAELRKKIGAEARKKIIDQYSVSSTKQNFFSLFYTN